MIKGWAWQWLSQLNFDADSWTAPQDAVQVHRNDTTTTTAEQIRAHTARLRQCGQTGTPTYVMDGGYDQAPLTYELAGELDQLAILIRLRNDLVMYRDPPPPVTGQAGRPRRHSAEAFRFKDAATWGEPDQTLITDHPGYGTIVAMSWAGLHPKLTCRGHFAN